jgi:hypothetical protein
MSKVKVLWCKGVKLPNPQEYEGIFVESLDDSGLPICYRIVDCCGDDVTPALLDPRETYSGQYLGISIERIGSKDRAVYNSWILEK